MSTRCCDDYSCAEIYPSKCIKYTGPQKTTNVLYKEFEGCNPNMQEVVELYDNHISDLLLKGGVDTAALKAASDACGLNLLNLANLSTYTYNQNKYVEGEVVVQLVNALCNVSKRLNYLMNESQTKQTDVFWLDLPLNKKLDLKCLIDDPCFGVNGPTTLKELLQAMINKLCP